jgi:hypothetical protein
VLLKKPKKGKSKGAKPGTLTLKAKCNQAATVTLSGALTENGKEPAHGKAKAKKFNLGPVQSNVQAGGATSLTVQFPAAALNALKSGAAESVVFTLTAGNANGKGQASATIGHLQGIG